MAVTTCVRLISGLMILSIVPSDAVTCYECNSNPVHPQLQSNCHLPLDSQAAQTTTCDGQLCQSILYTSPEQSITVERCLQYSQVLGIEFFLIENQCCYSVANTTGTYTHCFCQDDFCNYNLTQPVLDGRPTTTMSQFSSVQLEVITQSPAEAPKQRQSVTCYDCRYSAVNAGATGESTCSEPFNSTGISTCSARACYNYAYVEGEQYIIIRGCDEEGNFDFQSEEQCLQYGQIYNGTFFVHENQCCYTITGRWNALTVCYCHSDLCNTNVSRPVLVFDALTTDANPPPLPALNFSTFLPTVVRNITEANQVLKTTRSKRYTPPVSLKTTTMPTKRPNRPTELKPLTNSRATTTTTPKTSPLSTASDSSASMNNTTTITTARSSTPFTPPMSSSITCYNCSYFPSSESANDSVCRSSSGLTAVATCTGIACYFYAYTSEKGISMIDRKCDKDGTVVFQSDEECLQYSKVYNLIFFTFEHQCCYNTDVSGMPVTVCFCNTELCNSNRFRPMPQTATSPSTTSISNPVIDILPSSHSNTTTSGSNVNTTEATTLNTTSIDIPPTGSDGANVTSTAGPLPITVTSSGLWTTQSSSEINGTRTTTTTTTTTTTPTSPFPTIFSSTQKTSPMLSNTNTTISRQVRCYDCTYFPNSDSTGTSLCNNVAGSTDLPTCVGRSCYTYAYVSERGVVAIYRACDIEGTLEFQSDEQCLRYSQVHHLTFFTYQHQCCYITDANGLPVTVCFCNTDLCNSNRSRPTKKRR